MNQLQNVQNLKLVVSSANENLAEINANEMKEVLQYVEQRCINLSSLEVIGTIKGEYKAILDKIRNKMVGSKIILGIK